MKSYLELIDSQKTIEPEIEAVLKIHKFLVDSNLQNTMDFNKREDKILAEIERIKAIIKSHG